MFYNIFMAVLEIKKYPEKILKEKAASINNIDAAVDRFIDDMIETMQAAHGVGLAANQVGVLQKVCVIDLRSKENKIPLIVLINPLIAPLRREICCSSVSALPSVEFITFE